VLNFRTWKTRTFGIKFSFEIFVKQLNMYFISSEKRESIWKKKKGSNLAKTN